MSQNEEVADKVKSEINEFIRDMKKFSDDKMSDISKILKNDKEKLIDNSMVESFKEGQIWLQELKKVESVRHSIEYHEETISNLLSTYFRSQEDQLANNKGASSKDPKELMKNFEIIQNTIKRISAIAQYGGEDIVAEANKLKENVLTELQDVTPRLVESFSVNAR
jgi:signal recognition particle GTPase